MAPLIIPLDGRITSQNILSGPLTGGEVMEIVSPGNAALGVTYQITTGVLAQFFTGFAGLNTEIITAGATSITPYMVLPTDTKILFNKIIGAPSYAVLPLSASLTNAQPILFKDLKGDAATNNITITFSGGQLCDGLSSIVLSTAYGWTIVNPVPGGNAWYMAD